MRQYIRPNRPALSLALTGAALTVLAACGGKDERGALANDSALGRDLALAQQDSVQPQLQDVPAPPAPAPTPAPAAEPPPAPQSGTRAARPSPRPSTPAPAPAPVRPAAPAPAAEVPVTGTVAAGTSLTFASTAKVCSNATAVGDTFTAELTEAVNATNGVTLPAGATGTFAVTEAKTAQNNKDETYLRVRLVSVQFGGRTYPVESTVQTATTDRVRSADRSADAKKVAGGAILGAIAGQVIGKGTKGTVIGAAAGAAAGTAAAAATANYDTCLNPGANIVVTLDGTLTVRPAPAR